jgi:RNA polymerase sigma-70 factor (ECF subfamily)
VPVGASVVKLPSPQQIWRANATSWTRSFPRPARFAEPALVDGAVGIVVAPKGKLALVLRFGVVGDKISEIDIAAAPQRLSRFSLALLDR